MKKHIRIYALPSHQTKERTSGVDFVRIIQPMTHLNGYSDNDISIECDVFDTDDKTDWLYVAKNYDIIYFNYLNSAWSFAAMGAMARHYKRTLIMDMDDSLWHLKDDNPAHAVYHKGSQALQDFTAICNEVDYITCTNSYLKNVIINNTRKYADKVKVFPNYIDLQKYSHVAQFKDNKQITLLHYGSTTHFIDLSNTEFIKGVDRIMKEYPNVTITFVGAFLPKLKLLWGQRINTVYGDSDIHKWIAEKFPMFMDQTDILICPLEDNPYTRCKSGIKFKEASSAKIPGVYQNMRQYQAVIDHGVNGYLAQSSDDWYKSLKSLIDDPNHRQSVGEAAYTTVKEGYQIQDHVADYATWIKQVMGIDSV